MEGARKPFTRADADGLAAGLAWQLGVLVSEQPLTRHLCRVPNATRHRGPRLRIPEERPCAQAAVEAAKRTGASPAREGNDGFSAERSGP